MPHWQDPLLLVMLVCCRHCWMYVSFLLRVVIIVPLLAAVGIEVYVATPACSVKPGSSKLNELAAVSDCLLAALVTTSPKYGAGFHGMCEQMDSLSGHRVSVI